MPKHIILIGEKFSRLTILSEIESVRYKKSVFRRVRCKCDCGNEIETAYQDVLKGHTKSCGCIHKEQLSARMKKHGATIGGETKEYMRWKAIMQRCYNPKHRRYKDYGGRGIEVCERWHSFENFIADVGKMPSTKHTIDRFPNNNGNYEPSNFRWATVFEQNNNKRSNIWLTYNGETDLFTHWAKRLGISVGILRRRIKEKPFEVVAAGLDLKNQLTRINQKYYGSRT